MVGRMHPDCSNITTNSRADKRIVMRSIGHADEEKLTGGFREKVQMYNLYKTACEQHQSYHSEKIGVRTSGVALVDCYKCADILR
jgi:hypothetical protein